ncbi:uncharacterized protein LY89DRAFT_764088 [Mollisia scopiformis]|uniref:Uncharacterized protein n=1 Tax=Mollisia scopiformis TaxID=149040 RepID=A0A132B8M8_MOLSC|nr:uncharacterized protein LY89DRAFT_764088 [Mollisia scopiformis]KUJ08755.1 hypothetical protein LY89DRAFT_764088 [Mollisia scopiformis]
MVSKKLVPLNFWLVLVQFFNTINADFTLYAYGTNISGLPVFYMNSLAYIGYQIPSDLGGTNITFTMNDTSLYPQKNTTAGGSGTITGNPKLYIDTSTDAIAQPGFTTNDTDTTAATTTGFRFLGTDIYWKASDGTLLANFWATETDMDGVWSLVWNEPDDTLDNSTPVVIQNMAPAARI